METLMHGRLGHLDSTPTRLPAEVKMGEPPLPFPPYPPAGREFSGWVAPERDLYGDWPEPPRSGSGSQECGDGHAQIRQLHRILTGSNCVRARRTTAVDSVLPRWIFAIGSCASAGSELA